MSFPPNALHKNASSITPFIKVLICIVCLWIPFGLQAQLAPDLDTQREFRGVWISTIFGIDYPKEPSNSDIFLKTQWTSLLDQLKETGLNTVIVQVRSVGDAIYPSQYAPWSEHVTGQQGLAPTNDLDLLDFMVKETHKRGMQFHAWFNPYRVSMDLDTFSLKEPHIFHTHREWLEIYGGRLYLNPALPEVWQHITDVIMEVVDRYDIDAVHFDDYFYPYPIGELKFPDREEFLELKRYDESLAMWRRRNVDALIEKLSKRIRESKPWVRFGVSPFGVWRNKDEDPDGSYTRTGTTSYDHLHADVRNWLQRGWIDYVIPQLYWDIDYGPADHRKLLTWWADHAYEKQLIIGHAAYKVGRPDGTTWKGTREISRQVTMSRANRVSVGSCFFSASSILDNRFGLRDSIRYLFREPALPPINPAMPYEKPETPPKVVAKWKKDAMEVAWKPAPTKTEAAPSAYALYRKKSPDSSGEEVASPELIQVIGHERDKRKYRFLDRQTIPGADYTYQITTINQYYQESPPVPIKKPVKSKRKPGSA